MHLAGVLFYWVDSFIDVMCFFYREDTEDGVTDTLVKSDGDLEEERVEGLPLVSSRKKVSLASVDIPLMIILVTHVFLPFFRSYLQILCPRLQVPQVIWKMYMHKYDVTCTHTFCQITWLYIYIMLFLNR